MKEPKAAFVEAVLREPKDWRLGMGVRGSEGELDACH